jgi:acyl carrier protein
MSSSERQELHALILELLEEAEKELDVEIGDDTSLIQSGLLDSLALLEVAEWVSDRLDGPLDLNTVDIRNEWDTVAGILCFAERRSKQP